MNALDRAKERMKSGWCKSLYHDGKFCSSGALAQELTDHDLFYVNDAGSVRMLPNAYEIVDRSREGKILAEIIKEQYPEYIGRDEWSVPCDAIVDFNDDSEDFDRIEAVFEKASARFEEQV